MSFVHSITEMRLLREQWKHHLAGWVAVADWSKSPSWFGSAWQINSPRLHYSPTDSNPDNGGHRKPKSQPDHKGPPSMSAKDDPIVDGVRVWIWVAYRLGEEWIGRDKCLNGKKVRLGIDVDYNLDNWYNWALRCSLRYYRDLLLLPIPWLLSLKRIPRYFWSNLLTSITFIFTFKFGWQYYTSMENKEIVDNNLP